MARIRYPYLLFIGMAALFCLPGSAQPDSKNFNGKIIYAFRYIVEGQVQKELRITYLFTDSTVTTYAGEQQDQFEVAMLNKNLTLYHRRSFGDSLMVIEHGDTNRVFSYNQKLLVSDKMMIIGRECTRLSGKYTISQKFASHSTVFDAYLSDTRFNCPREYSEYDLVYNNKTGRIPLLIRKTETVMTTGNSSGSTTVIEMEAVLVLPR